MVTGTSHTKTSNIDTFVHSVLYTVYTGIYSPPTSHGKHEFKQWQPLFRLNPKASDRALADLLTSMDFAKFCSGDYP